MKLSGRHRVLFLVLCAVATDAVLFATMPQHLHLPLRSLLAGIPLFMVAGYFVASARKTGLEQIRHLREMDDIRSEMNKRDLRYKNLLEQAGDAIFIIDAQRGEVQEMNRRAVELFGYSREQLNGMSGKDLVAGPEQEKYVSLVRMVLKGVVPPGERITFLRNDRSAFIGEVAISLVDLGDEKVAQAVIRDVTTQVQGEKELLRRNTELSVLNAMITRATAELRVESAAEVTLDQAVASLGAHGGAIHLLDPGRNEMTRAVQKGSDAGQLSESVSLAAVPCSTLHDMRVNIGCSGEGCPLAGGARGGSLTAIPLLAQGKPIGVMHLIYPHAHYQDHDVAVETSFFQTLGSQMGLALERATLFRQIGDRNKELMHSCRLLERSSRSLAVSESRLKENLELVELANHELERLDKMKTQFLGMVSHEFRTPLTTIISGADFLLSEAASLPEEHRGVLEIVRSGGERLHEIVTDLLKVAHLEAKQVSVHKKPVELDELLRSMLEEIGPFLLERSQSVIVEDVSRIPFFQGDRHYLKEVLVELVGNAMKFTPDGGTITISAVVTGAADLAPKKPLLKQFHESFYDRMQEKLYLQITITDTGIGISSGEQLRIFDKFYEVGEISHHSSGDYKFQGKGTGLGLAIVRGIIDAHGGMIWVESSPAGQGSSFFILIPLEAEGERQAAFPFAQ